MSTSAIDTFNSLGLATTGTTSAAPQKQTLGQDQFLKLLTTQMTHQDPLKPMDNGEFLGQMAQFSTVSGIQDLQASFKEFAGSISSNQALQASGLVGRYVSAPSEKALLGAGGSVSGDFEMPASSSNVGVKIIDPETGATIREIDLGAESAGTTRFEWDGKDGAGNLADPGVYKIQAYAYLDGKNTVLPTNIKSLVKSVTMANGNTAMQVNLDGLGPVKFSQIKQIL
ncbi:flagellar hook assembly protein FlgD [Methylomonas sp. SURF-1]|uniref:Basal-body rod modification protein FlgD n=1 Tax=Methylomonas aurea TaxID=2952224 RepID=A0ABT1UEZ5_9GAMM|nr:flagellar hook assembly protein FlgD [Methylomonas sp. SURF-1]MCQ8180802.1 flagellar hook assembly protein FlgD [Methylomonas sp. SURF-1]